MPGIAGLPSSAGTPPIFTIIDALTPGVGITVLVVHGLLAGDGGTGHVVGLAEMSDTRSAGAPPTITWNCLGMITTGPEWQQVMTALALTSGGKDFLVLKVRVSIATATSNGNHPQG
jgi:hypothetical protein